MPFAKLRILYYRNNLISRPKFDLEIWLNKVQTNMVGCIAYVFGVIRYLFHVS